MGNRNDTELTCVFKEWAGEAVGQDRVVMCCPHVCLRPEDLKAAAATAAAVTKSKQKKMFVCLGRQRNSPTQDHILACDLKSHTAGVVLFSVKKRKMKNDGSIMKSVCSDPCVEAYLAVRVGFLVKMQSLASHIKGAFSLIIFYLFTSFFLCLVLFGFQCMRRFWNHICAVWAAKWCWSCAKEQELKAHWTV